MPSIFELKPHSTRNLVLRPTNLLLVRSGPVRDRLKVQTDQLEQIEAASADNVQMRITSTASWCAPPRPLRPLRPLSSLWSTALHARCPSSRGQARRGRRGRRPLLRADHGRRAGARRPSRERLQAQDGRADAGQGVARILYRHRSLQRRRRHGLRHRRRRRWRHPAGARLDGCWQL